MIMFCSDMLERRIKVIEDRLGIFSTEVYDWSGMKTTGMLYAQGLCKRIEELENEIKKLKKGGRK